MALTTSNMGLREWNLGGDNFSYTELANNWALLDVHDHTGGKGVQIPTGGLVNQAVTTAKLADGSVTDVKVAASTLTDAKLASPNSGAYKIIYRATSDAGTASGAATYFLNNGLITVTPTTQANAIPDVFNFIGGDFAIPNKNTVLSVRGTVGTNATAPGITFTFGLYPVTITGGSGAWSISLGTVVAGSTAAVATPGASAFTSATSSDFGNPGDGVYALGVVFSGGAAANSRQTLHSTLRLRNT